MNCQTDWFSLIQTVSTIVLVVVTSFYVWLTWRILSASIISSKDAKMPVLVFRFRDEPEKKYIGERMVNVGVGPALDIRLQSNAVFKDNQFVEFEKGRVLEPWRLPVDNIIGPDNGDPELQVCYFLSQLNTSILKNPDVELLATYKDVFGREFRTRFMNLENKFEQVKP